MRILERVDRMVGIRGGGKVDRTPTERLRRRGDFDNVFRTGRHVANRLLVVRAAPNGLDRSRIGFAAGRQLGGAVVRNRLRRRWREVVRLGPSLPPGWDIVLVARRSAAEAEWSSLAGAWRDALGRCGLAGARG